MASYDDDAEITRSRLCVRFRIAHTRAHGADGGKPAPGTSALPLPGPARASRSTQDALEGRAMPCRVSASVRFVRVAAVPNKTLTRTTTCYLLHHLPWPFSLFYKDALAMILAVVIA